MELDQLAMKYSPKEIAAETAIPKMNLTTTSPPLEPPCVCLRGRETAGLLGGLVVRGGAAGRSGILPPGRVGFDVRSPPLREPVWGVDDGALPRWLRSSLVAGDQRQLVLPAHCLTQIVTLRKWLPQLRCYRKLGRQPRGRRHLQDGEAGTCGDDQGPLPTGIQEGQREDTGRIHCDNRPPSQARHQAAGRHC